MRKVVISCFLLLALPFAGSALAQNEPQTPAANKTAEPPVHYYHLDLLVQEVGEDGKPVNSRTYSYTVSTAPHEHDQIRIGSRVPIPVGNNQFQHQDINVNLDVSNAHEVGNKLAMILGAEVNSLGPVIHVHPPDSSGPGPVEPVIHRNTWTTPILIPIGKPTVVFTSDDIDSKGGMRVVVTANLIQ